MSRLKADLVEVDWEATGLTYIAVEAVWHVRRRAESTARNNV